LIIKKLSIDGYKNLRGINLTLDPRLNVFCGENAQGKTNIIEAIWLSSGCKSFRGTKEKDFVNLTGEIAKINISFENNFREQEISVAMARANIKEKNITLNGVPIKILTKLFGNLKCVIFTPEDLELSKGSPDNRRSYLDLCISQIKNGYKDVVNKYDYLILQRNTLLKNISQGFSKENELEVWDEQIARIGSYISALRFNYTKKLNIFSKNLYEKLSSGKEVLELSYNSTVFKKLDCRTDFNGEMACEYLCHLKKNLRDDIRTGCTQIGIHRDDLITKINGLYSRDYGSQGQQRSIALVLKLSQAYILLEETKDAPVVLLDDVLSELDSKRQNFILSAIENMQVIITCCNSEIVKTKDNGKLFIVKNGAIDMKKIGGS